LLSGCSGNDFSQDQGGDGATAKEETMQGNIVVTSSAFVQGKEIPAKYTADGADVSPSLDFEKVPAGTKSLAVICDDPDAPTREKPRPQGPWVHWVIYNLPTNISPLPEGIARQAKVQQIDGALQGKNSFPSDNVGYRGPAPPPGSGPHRYFFTVYALDAMLDLPAEKADKASLLNAMNGHILDQGQLMGTYERKG
jgi:Raf kinase inhibitor-like YbhB/YbcL family protein